LPEPLGRACIVPLRDTKMITAVDCTIARVDDQKCDKQYLLHFLQSPQYFWQIGKHIAGSTRLRISRKNLQTIEISLPPLPVQKQIADVLDRASTLIEKRKAQIAKLDLLVKARFVEMFGDPVTNSKGFQKSTIESICSTIVDCPHNTPTYLENGKYPCIRTSDLVDGYLAISSTTKYIDEKEYTERIKRHKPYAGDIIYSREGERFGIAAIIPDNLTICLGQRVMLFVPKKDKATSEYLWGALNSNSVYTQAKNSVGGATSPHVNIKDIQNFKILSPPLPFQKKFADFVCAVDKSKLRMQQELNKLTLLYKSLMQKCFKEEMFNG
jgi:type I restriction enzyme S subunit